MPRNYVRIAPNRKLITEDQINKAKKLIAEGKSQRRAAEEVNISEGALRKRLKTNHVPRSLGRFKPTFTEAQEAEFAVHIKKLDDMFFGITINDLRQLAYEYATANRIENRFDTSTKMAGRDWVEGFLRRQTNLTLRQSAPTSLARAIGFNRAQVQKFYKNLKDVYEKYQFQPNRIYNMDETGMSTVPKKTPKVVSVKGKKVVGKVVSAERGITVTAVMCMSVTGHFIPPAFIYPRKRTRPELLHEGPMQSICMVSDSGFINTSLFLKWLEHFKSFAHPSQDEPVLLIMDNHSSHISLEGTSYARDNHIVILTLPPHGSHKLQPLDVAVHGPLKTKYAIECEKWMNRNPGRGITQFQIASLFNTAYKHTASLSNAESGFRSTGIYPFADDLFDEIDFAPSNVTDQFAEIDNSRISDSTPNETIKHSFIQHDDIAIQDISEETCGTNIYAPHTSLSALDESHIQESLNQLLDDDVSDFIVGRDDEKSPPLTAKLTQNIGDTHEINLIVGKEDLKTPLPARDSIQGIGLIEERKGERTPPVITEPSQELSMSLQNELCLQGDVVQQMCSNIKVTSASYHKDEEAIVDAPIQLRKHPVTVAELSPLPKMKEKKKKVRASLKSEIITSTPFKIKLEELEEKKQKKKPQLKLMSPETEPGPSTKRNTKKKQKRKKTYEKKPLLPDLRRKIRGSTI